MARRATIVGAVVDFEGRSWDVREFRSTGHGFALAIGWPDGRRGKGYGGPGLIPTRNPTWGLQMCEQLIPNAAGGAWYAERFHKMIEQAGKWSGK